MQHMKACMNLKLMILNSPTLRRLIDSNQKQVVGLAKRSVESLRNAQSFEHKYEEACHKLGISVGVSHADMKSALMASTSLLPSLLHEVQVAAHGYRY
jgi:predicted DNA-binding protein (UPF0251 family)